MSEMDDARSELTDPDLPPERLAEIAYEYPELRPEVARHPAVYDGLLHWLADLGDPDIDAALAERSGDDGGAVGDTTPADLDGGAPQYPGDSEGETASQGAQQWAEPPAQAETVGSRDTITAQLPVYERPTAALPPVVAPAPWNEQRPNRRAPVFIALGAAVFVALVAGAIVVALLLGRGNENSAAPSGAPATSQTPTATETASSSPTPTAADEQPTDPAPSPSEAAGPPSDSDPTPATGAYGLPLPADNAADQVRYLSQLIEKSKASRSTLVDTVSSLNDCSASDYPAALARIKSVSQNRRDLLAALETAPVDQVPNGDYLLGALQDSLQHSLAADLAFEQWASQIVADGCPAGQPARERAVAESDAATGPKTDFSTEWNASIVPQFGVPPVTVEGL